MTRGRPTGGFNAGEMRHRVTIQQAVKTVDSFGQPIVTWQDLYVNEPAKYEPVNGAEIQRGRQTVANAKAIFTVRYREGYQTTMQVVINGEAFGITYINQVDGRNRYLELIASNA